jgi:hypothetical protein
MTPPVVDNYEHFVRIPHTEIEALERGDINRLMFDILGLLHQWCDFHTGIARSVSAQRIADHLGYDKPPSLNTIRRYMHALIDSGWIGWDYRAQYTERTYSVWLCNYPTTKEKIGMGGVSGESPWGVSESVLNPSNIIPWRKTERYHGESLRGVVVGSRDESTNQIASRTLGAPHGADAPAECDGPTRGIAPDGSSLSGAYRRPLPLGASPSLTGKGCTGKPNADAMIESIQIFLLDYGVGHRIAPGLIRRVLKNFSADDIKDTLAAQFEGRFGIPLTAAESRRTVKDFFGTDRCVGNAAAFVAAHRASVAEIAKLKKERAERQAIEKAASDKAAVEKARIAEEQRKREVEEQTQRQRDWDAQRQREAAESRAKLISKMTETFAGWGFDGVDTWTAPYKVKVRLGETSEFASVTDTKGNITRYPTSDVDALAYRAAAAD